MHTVLIAFTVLSSIHTERLQRSTITSRAFFAAILFSSGNVTRVLYKCYRVF
jgi:hypothetical protein